MIFKILTFEHIIIHLGVYIIININNMFLLNLNYKSLIFVPGCTIEKSHFFIQC